MSDALRTGIHKDPAGRPRQWYVNGVLVAGADSASHAEALLTAAITADSDPPATVGDVKAEAGRRILARYPLHVQLNMQARETELLLIGPDNWSADDAAEAAGLRAARDWIKRVRATSNALELDLPDNVADDSVWPE